MALSGTIALLVVLAGRTLSAECPTLVSLNGAEDLTRELTSILAGRAVAVTDATSDEGCGVLSVDVARAPDSYQIVMRDQAGRIASRSIQRLETAAILIASWARLDLIAGAEPLSVPVKARSRPPRTITIHHDAEPPPLMLRLSGEIGIARDGQRWLGARVSGCGRIGFACVGLASRFAGARHRQKASDFLLELKTPLEAGAFTVAPAFSVGVGRLSRRDPSCGEDDTCERVKGEWNPRAEFGLTGAVAFGAGFSALFGASATGGWRLGAGSGLDRTASIVRGELGLTWVGP